MKLIKPLATGVVLSFVAANVTSAAAMVARNEKYQDTKLGNFCRAWSSNASSFAYGASYAWSPHITQTEFDTVMEDAIRIVTNK